MSPERLRRTFYDEMVKDEQVLAGVVGKLSSGKPWLGPNLPCSHSMVTLTLY